MKQIPKTVLVYGLAPMQLLQLHAVFQPLGIRCIAVSDSMTACRVDELLEGTQTAGAPGIPLLGSFALLAGFGGKESEAIAAMNLVAPGIIKAVRTETNGSWRFLDLCTEIAQEFRLMNRRK